MRTHSIFAFLLAASSTCSRTEDSNRTTRMSPDRTAFAVGVGVPALCYHASLIVSLDSTDEHCVIVSVSGYPDSWETPPLVLSGSIGWSLHLSSRSVLRPVFGLGDLGVGHGGVMWLIKPRLDLWAEFRISFWGFSSLSSPGHLASVKNELIAEEASLGASNRIS